MIRVWWSGQQLQLGKLTCTGFAHVHSVTFGYLVTMLRTASVHSAIKQWSKPEVERTSQAAAWALSLTAAALRAAASCPVDSSAVAAASVAAAPEPFGCASCERTACACRAASWTDALAAAV